MQVFGRYLPVRTTQLPSGPVSPSSPTPAPGLVVVAGGKFTTYFVMAKVAMDEASRVSDEKVPESCTETIPVLGATGFEAAWNRRNRRAHWCAVHVARVEHLLSRYSSLVPQALQQIKEPPELADPLPGADDYLRAEVVYATTHEGALHVNDVLTRRHRISIDAWDRGVSAAPVAARLMADIVGWSATQEENKVANYVARVEAERLSQQQPDDVLADAARLEVPGILPMA